ALGIAFGWAACLMGGCAYGNLGEGLGYAVLPDLYGVEASRFATQAVGLGFSLLLFVAVWLTRRRWPFAGALSLLYGLLYFAVAFFLEFTRGDEAIYLGPWRLAQVLNIALTLAAGLGLLVLWWRWRARTDDVGPEATADAPVTPAGDAGDETVAEEPAGPETQDESLDRGAAEAGETAEVD
ncbi:MAG: prolipoprotein diacylglyceryl transferase family protein, partial [Anaerolineae bacterium]